LKNEEKRAKMVKKKVKNEQNEETWTKYGQKRSKNGGKHAKNDDFSSIYHTFC
jgi:hypothetical protein